jgi:23S rRNA (adenine2030-N6)-methyltransferase
LLSYRHSYHAGNFADVLKHLVQIRILRYLKLKDKPLCYIDTHAAAGGYALQAKQAQQTREYEGGIGQLWKQKGVPEIVADYVALVHTFNGRESLTHYPGSPWFAKQLLSPQDRLWLYELHNNEVELLKQTFNGDRRARVIHEDGFQGCIGLLPPKERRGLVLIDPPYEIKEDYQRVVDTVINAHRRFAVGTYAIWYPVVDRQRIDKLKKSLVSSGIKNIQLFELGQRSDSPGHGMTASGMIVINPPWVLKDEMTQVLPYLAEKLGIDGEGRYRVEQLVAE